MIINLDFNAIICDKGHTNAATAKECSICGEIFEDINKKELLHEIRKQKLERVFNVIVQKEHDIKELCKAIRENTIQLDEIDDEHKYLHNQIKILREISSADVFENLDLRSEALASNEFDNTLLELENFYKKIYEPINNTIKFKSLTNSNKNSKNRILRIAYAAKEAYLSLLDCTVADSMENAQIKEVYGQQKIDEVSSETRILGRLYSSASIDNSVDLFSSGEMNYSAFSAMTLFNQNEGSIEETINVLSQDSYFYFRNYLTKNYEDYKVDDFLLLAMYMNSSLMLFDENEYFKKLNTACNILNSAYREAPNDFATYISGYKDRYIFMMNKVYELHVSASFIFSNNPNEKIVILHSIKWYKDLCEGVYRDTSIMLYSCCELLKNKHYDSSILKQTIGFADIANRFNSLNSKYKLSRLTDGIHQIVRHAEAHVDYEINHKDKVIIFRNKKKGLSETISFDKFMSLFSHLQETINVMINAFEIFLLNHDEFMQDAKDVHSTIEANVPITQSDIAPILRGIVTVSKEKREVNGECILDIEGVCIKDEGLGSCENLLSIFFTIVKCDKQYDVISLNVDDADGNSLCNIIMETKYLKNLDLSNRNSKYMLGFVKFIFNSKLPAFPNKKGLLYDMYFNIITNLLSKINIINELKKGLMQGNVLPNSIIDLAKELVEDCEYIVSILVEVDSCVSDKRLNEHVCQIIDNLKIGFIKLSAYKNVDTIFYINNKSISNEMLKLTEMFDLFKGDIEEELFYRTKTIVGINTYKNIGRNDPCPCGSGKKYKKCCGAN